MDEVAEQDEGGGGVEKGVVPGFLRDKGADFIAEAELIADAAERVVWQVRPSGTGEQKRVDPRAETVARKGPQKTLFRAFSVGDHDRAGEAFF
jgi:hypothetical protein